MMQVVASTNRLKARFILGLLVIGFGVLTIGFAGDASAQSNRDLQNRIDRLEKEIETLSRALFRGEQPAAGSFSGAGSEAARADAEIRLSQMETELRNIRGQFEEQSHETRQLREEVERLKGDLELRIQDLENGRGGSAGNTSSTRSGSNAGGAKFINRNPSAGGTGNAPIQRGSGYRWDSGDSGKNEASPQAGQLGSYTQNDSGAAPSDDLAAATYENAFSMLKKEQYDVAQKEFQLFVDQYPDHPLAGNAKYWLGETYYVRGDYAKAARLFAEGFKLYPNNSKSADNLLKLGMSLAALDKTADACVALSQIEKEGFSASAPVLRRASQEKTRLGC